MSGRPAEAICANCIYWTPVIADINENGVENVGECREGCPPHIVHGGEDAVVSWSPPRTAAGYWCGDWEGDWEKRRIRR